MKTSFDTDKILFQLLNGNQDVKSAISGMVYKRDRPLNSTLQDIVVSTITLSQDDYPQLGVSNVNIHVPDRVVTISGIQQNVADEAKMEVISTLVLATLREANIPGLEISIDAQTTLEEAEIKQHFVNIRINWFIVD